MKLADLAVEKYRPDKKRRREILDGGCEGLYLVVQPSGFKSWAMRFRRSNGGKPAKLTLGPLFSGEEPESEPVLGMPLTLVSARNLAAEVHRQRAMGRDPIADYEAAKRRQKFDQEKGAATTFAAAARDFVEQHAMKKTRRWQNTALLLGFDPKAGLEIVSGGLAHRWCDKAVSTIDSHDIYTLTDEVRRLGVPGRKRRSEGPTEARARSMLATLSKMFNWLMQHRRVEKNPCTGVHRPETPMARDRVLSNAEIARFWTGTDAERFGALFKLLLLTGCRLNEVGGMRRSELSDDLSVWTIPGHRTKNRRVHVVPLPPMAREMIATVLKKMAGQGDLIFSTTGTTPTSGSTPIKRRLDAVMKTEPWRFHDLRRTFVTGMAELGVRGDVIELAVNHVSGLRGGIAGVYNRSELLPERRAALERWAKHIKGLTADKPAENVVDLALNRRRSK
jgi:integrase